MSEKTDLQAWIIKIAAVITAAPRWVSALLMAEGFVLPDAWLTWWIPLSAVMAAGMAVVEGWAFAYIFQAWRNQSGKASRMLAILAFASAVIFVVVLSPYIAASVLHAQLSDVLGNSVALYIWSAAVAASTIAIVATVGFAQKSASPQASGGKRRSSDAQAEQEAIPEIAELFSCDVCGAQYATQNALNAHGRKHMAEAKNGKAH